MGWDATLPADDQKLRTLGTVVRNNFEAVEEGDEATGGTPITQRAVLLGDRSAIASAANPTEVAGTVFLYNNQDTAAEELYVRRPIDTGSGVQMTNGAFTNASSGTSFLPGGLIIQWGVSGSIGGNSSAVITYNRAFPTAVYCIQITGNPSSLGVQNWGVIGAAGLSTFTLGQGTGATNTAYWMAIGT